MIDNELEKAYFAYQKASADLIKERDRVFPIDTKVRNSRIRQGKITRGSFYPDQVIIDGAFHVSIMGLKVVENK